MGDDSILVLGATGKTGRRVLARLRMLGAPVRAASRSSEAAFDWADSTGWDAALDGIATVYIVPPDVPGPVYDFVARAEAAGVTHLVLLSGRGADQWGDTDFGAGMLSAEDAVRGSQLGWTVVRSSNFSQNFDEELFHEPLVAGELALPAGAMPEPFIDLEDVADVMAEILTEPSRHSRQTYELSGPRALTFAEATELISRASGLFMTYRRVSADDYAVALVNAGLSEVDARSNAAMFVMMDRGIIADPTDDVAAVLGRAPRTFEEYVVRTAAAGGWRR
ncbi:NAD(P)H-binding protein [Agreia sp.]|uniref:NAD(P)H-binding protein n=1 Tax=Agreia sp. TaxID=1872416 RepID=UPI0035BC4D62